MEAIKAIYFPQFLNVGDLCQMLKMNRSTVYRQIQEGKFPAPIKIGKCSRWRYSEIASFLDEKQQQTNKPKE